MRIRSSILMFSLVYFTGCATRTKYAPNGEQGGYSLKATTEKMLVARFTGNVHTVKKDASLFSKFRAYEVCVERGFKTVNYIEQRDLTKETQVQHTSSYQYQAPTTVNATASKSTSYNPYGGGYGIGTLESNTSTSGTINHGSKTGGSSTWVETNSYPVFDTVFTCENSIYRMGIEMNPVSPADMRPYVKDLMGGLQVGNNFKPNSPNIGRVTAGDLIVKINGSRVDNIEAVRQAVELANNKDRIETVLSREGKHITVYLQAVNVVSDVDQMLGKMISAACSVPEIQKRPACVNRHTASAH